MLNSCGLRDLSFKGERFTWANKRVDEGFMQERLDRYVCSLEWSQLFPMLEVINLPYLRSNYRLVKVFLGPSQVCVRRLGNSKNSRRFYFEEVWAM